MKLKCWREMDWLEGRVELLMTVSAPCIGWRDLHPPPFQLWGAGQEILI